MCFKKVQKYKIKGFEKDWIDGLTEIVLVGMQEREQQRDAFRIDAV